jgi:hypothetical protein
MVRGGIATATKRDKTKRLAAADQRDEKRWPVQRSLLREYLTFGAANPVWIQNEAVEAGPP